MITVGEVKKHNLESALIAGAAHEQLSHPEPVLVRFSVPSFGPVERNMDIIRSDDIEVLERIHSFGRGVVASIRSDDVSFFCFEHEMKVPENSRFPSYGLTMPKNPVVCGASALTISGRMSIEEIDSEIDLTFHALTQTPPTSDPFLRQRVHGYRNFVSTGLISSN